MSTSGEYLCDPSDPDVCEPCQKLSKLEKKIKKIRMMLADLDGERRKLKQQINHHHDRLLHRLPLEIIAEIFEICVDDVVPDLDIGKGVIKVLRSGNVIRPQFVLSAVCRRWRDIAYSIPRLWKTLMVSVEPSYEGYLPDPMLVQQWIERARQIPLSIILSVAPHLFPEDHGDSTEAEAHRCAKDTAIRIINILNRCSDRWLKLHYEGPPELLPHLSSADYDLPRLRILSLWNYVNAHDDVLNLRPECLQILSLTRVSFKSVNFSCDHLIRLELAGVSSSDCLEALRVAPRLTHCALGSDVMDSWGSSNLPLPTNPITHPGIQHLRATFPLSKEVFEYLLCPSLKTLTICTPNRVLETLSIVNFLRISGCSLESLSLLGIAIPSDVPHLTPLCLGISKLQYLHIDCFRDWAPALKSLFEHLALFSVVDGRQEPQYLPALRSLSFKCRDIDDWEMLPHIFHDPAAHSAERYRHALETVTIHVDPYTRSSDFVDPFVNLREETLTKILQLEEVGVKLNIQLGLKEEDWIELALDHFGISSIRAAVNKQ